MNDGLWNSIFGSFDDIERRFERMFSELSNENSRTYGYTMYQGPDGIPHVREYGNAVGSFSPLISKGGDPFIDVTRSGDEISVIVELPGMSKEDVSLEENGKTLSIRAESKTRRFEKDVALPCEAVPGSSSATFNNGLLEVRMKARDEPQGGRRIEIS